LGLVLARQLSGEGARVAICARNAEQLQRAASELRGRGAVVFSQTCDLADPRQIADFFAAVRRELGPVDVLINNAGVIQVGPLEHQTVADYEESMAVHFWAPLHSIEQVLPDMRGRGAGRIVNISSFGGKVAVPHLVPYCAGKFALGGLSQGLRSELLPHGIYVTAIYPGLMRTGSPRNALFKGRHRAEYAWFTLGGAWPPASMSAERAARQIIDACRYGRAEATLSLPAKLAALANALAPELASDVAAGVARLLPRPGGAGAQALRGKDSTSALSPSLLTILNERAASRNNELTA
jgi:short-subunit dehydrogenase